ncbi:MAG: carbohydrate kinase family protein [bacterium]|nr:carbohydrate kinase family protein [bacterium]
MYDVITVGSATIDVFVYTDKSEIIRITEISEPGTKNQKELLSYPYPSKILIQELKFSSGGGGTNVAVSLAKLGNNVAYLGNLGDDANARRILRILKKDKIDFVGTIGKEMTSFSVILDSIEHDRTILTYKGASDHLKYEKINKAKLKTKWFYFSSMMSESFKTIEKLAKYAKKNKIKIVFNPSVYLAEKGAKYLKGIMDNTYILVVNQKEAKILSGANDVKSMLKKLHKLGPKIVVITKGKEGTEATDGKKHYIIKTNKSTKVVETTGAGDAFSSTFLAGLVKNKDISFSLKLATANAESVLSKNGAKNKLLSWREATKAMKRRPLKVQVKKL